MSFAHNLKSLRLLAVLFFICAPVWAHHSAQGFDSEREVTLAGSVLELEWANPHPYIQLEVQSDDGVSAVWAIEGPQLGFMRRIGWDRNTLAPGDPVAVTGYPSRNPDRRIVLGLTVEKADGTLLTMRERSRILGLGGVEAAAQAAENAAGRFVADGLSGNWLTRWDPTSPLVQPRTTWPLTERGRAWLASSSGSTPSDCSLTLSLPLDMVWPIMKEIEIDDEATIIRFEDEGERIIHMNISSHDGVPYADEGHSVGSWEGDVLVVDTARFSERPSGLGFGLAGSTEKHLIERFELSPDGATAIYTFQLEDPVYLADPVTGELELVYRPDTAVQNAPCDLEIARRPFEQ